MIPDEVVRAYGWQTAEIAALPGGLISAAIIAFGMQQAWRMTGAPQLQISGPYRIGPAPAALT